MGLSVDLGALVVVDCAMPGRITASKMKDARTHIRRDSCDDMAAVGGGLQRDYELWSVSRGRV